MITFSIPPESAALLAQEIGEFIAMICHIDGDTIEFGSNEDAFIFKMMSEVKLTIVSSSSVSAAHRLVYAAVEPQRVSRLCAP